MQNALIALVFAILCLAPRPVGAEAVSLLGSASVFAPRAALIVLVSQEPDAVRSGGGPSLFVGASAGGLFAPMAPRAVSPRRGAVAQMRPGVTGSRVERLRQLIGFAESRQDGYDAVQYGARIKPPDRPTRLTIAEIYRWIDATPGQPHAIGRYQFIPATLRRLVTRLGVPEGTVFSPGVQDRLADLLLVDSGYNAMADGVMERGKFMENLARIWAGLPTANGKSYYDGYAGNRASISWDQYEAEMRRIFPG